MELRYALDTAEEFAKIFFSLKNLKINDLLLYGSVSANKNNPNDLDLMIIHSNRILDKFLPISKDRKMNNSEKLKILQILIGKKINLSEKLKSTQTLNLINQNLLNLNYLNSKFFSDEKYKKWWNKLNEKFHDPSIKKGGRTYQTFLEYIFETGKLYNKNSKKYDLSPLIKYSFI